MAMGDDRVKRGERWPTSWVLLPVMLLGAGLRLVGINNVSPPGLAHDEVANWLIDRAILSGQHAIYFTEAYGHEAGFHYVQAGTVALLGDHALALRLPAAFMGLLGLAVTFALARQLFGRRVAVISTALLGVLFYPVFYARLGLRAIMLPMVSGLSATSWWRGWVRGRYGARYLALAGALAGLSLNTYMAARAVPIFYALFLVALVVLEPKSVRVRWRPVLAFWIALAAIAAPLVLYLLANPGAEFRISEIDAPLRALRQGNLRPVVDNAVDILGGFGFAGDPLWRQNVAPMPIFDPLLATFFYACLGLSILYVRDIRYLFLILWLLTATIPSIVTIDAPSSIRIINSLPVLTILPAIVMHNLGHLSTKTRWLSTGTVEKWGLALLTIGLIAWHTVRTTQAVFVTWPANDEVRFVWQEALTDVAGYLDRASHVQDVAVGGWTPDTMDPPTMAVTLRREDLTLRFFDPQQSLLVPASTSGSTAEILYPTILPVDPVLHDPLQAITVNRVMDGSFVRHALDSSPAPAPARAADVAFADEIVFSGYSPSATCQRPETGATCVIVTYWRVLRTPGAARRIFLHVVDGDGRPLDTGDALGAPASFWQPGDILLQKHEIAAGSLEAYDGLRLGLYNPQNGERLLTREGAPFVQFRPDESE